MAAAVRDDLLFVANVGDSRAYLVRDGAAVQLTRDHSLVATQVAAGLLAPDEAARARRNILTRALGQADAAEADIFSVALQPDDRVVLCSDGVHRRLAPAAERGDIGRGEPQAASQALVDLALARGATDNVSAVVLRYRAGDPAPAR